MPLCTLSSPYEPAEAVRADRSRLLFWLVGTAGAAVSALAMTIVLTSSGPGDRPLIALAQALVVALPVGVGLWAWRRQTHERFGRLLVAAGFLWALSTLAQSNSEVVYSIGRVGGWLVEPVLIWALLSYPSGRLSERLERRSGDRRDHLAGRRHRLSRAGSRRRGGGLAEERRRRRERPAREVGAAPA